jgi:hypothetical protein
MVKIKTVKNVPKPLMLQTAQNRSTPKPQKPFFSTLRIHNFKIFQVRKSQFSIKLY